MNEPINYTAADDTELDTTQKTRISELILTNGELWDKVSQLSGEVAILRARLDAERASPEEKRILLLELEKRYGISRRRACRLLNLARSTCWYRPTSDKHFSFDDRTRFDNVPSAVLIRRLKMVEQQLRAGLMPKDTFTMDMIEYALRRLGLTQAARLARMNLKLAMEIFAVYIEKVRQS